MQITISTHNGGSMDRRDHNIRNAKVVDKEKHIDKNGHKEIWLDIPKKEAYQQIFGQAVEEYNNRQKRADRKIKDYYTDIENNKMKHTCYEMILTIGNVNDYKSGILQKDQAKKILKEMVDTWQKRNHGLQMIGAYYHADEPNSAPHVHIDYIPVVRNCKRGLSVQTSLTGALKTMGFETVHSKNTAQIQWEHRENQELERLCTEHIRGCEVIHPQVGKGVKHQETEAFKTKTKLQSEINNIELKKDLAEFDLSQVQFETRIAQTVEKKAKAAAQQAKDQQKSEEQLLNKINAARREEFNKYQKAQKLVTAKEDELYYTKNEIQDAKENAPWYLAALEEEQQKVADYEAFINSDEHIQDLYYTYIAQQAEKDIQEQLNDPESYFDEFEL